MHHVSQFSFGYSFRRAFRAAKQQTQLDYLVTCMPLLHASCEQAATCEAANVTCSKLAAQAWRYHVCRTDAAAEAVETEGTKPEPTEPEPVQAVVATEPEPVRNGSDQPQPAAVGAGEVKEQVETGNSAVSSAAPQGAPCSSQPSGKYR